VASAGAVNPAADENVGRPTLRSHEENHAPRGRVRRGAYLLVAALATLALSGCSDEIKTGWLPSDKGMTEQSGRIIDLWNGSWIAALSVGVLVWGLTIWCIVAYRRRRDDVGLPPQVRYHIPLEILYTVVPLMMIGVLFYYTARDQAAIASTEKTPDVRISVVAKQWSWDFNYLDDQVYDAGIQAELNGKPGVERELPVLYLPVNERVEFTLTARDVIHSFWVPNFLLKRDMIPGVINRIQEVPKQEGTYQGRCAELCGEYHSEMLFKVKVVSRAEYDAHIQELRSRGQTGQLDTDLGRSPLEPKNEPTGGGE
jgi:cytochrome c oxidase subunit 2